MRTRAAERLEKARTRSVVEHDFPKLVEHHGASPIIKDNPPLIFHPSEELAPGYRTRYAEAIARYRESLAEHVRVLFDRFHFFDLALKVVGVGSVGTQCAVGLFMAADDDPLFLQVKEARASVLEPYAGKSLHPNHGQRVIAGQRLMQSASDIFLGWTQGIRPQTLLPAPAPRYENLRDHRRLGRQPAAGILENVRVGAGARARAVRRRRDDLRIHGFERNL